MDTSSKTGVVVKGKTSWYKGWYSCLQYEEDAFKAERITLGIAILVENEYLGVKLTSDFSKAAAFIGTPEKWIKQVMVGGANALFDLKPTFEAFEEYAATRANNFRMTPLRWTLVDIDRAKHLEKTFDQLSIT